MKKRFMAYALVAFATLSCATVGGLQTQSYDDGIYARPVAEQVPAVSQDQLDNLLADSRSSEAYILSGGDTLVVPAGKSIRFNKENTIITVEDTPSWAWNYSFAYSPWYFRDYYYYSPWYFSVLRNHDGLDEFVRNVGVIAGLDALLGRCKRGALAFHQEVVGFLNAVPALVAVHGVESAADRGHLTGGFGHLLFQFFHKAEAAAGVRVTAVHEGVHIHFVQAFFLGNAEELVHMVQGAVHTAMGGKSHQVQLLAALFHIIIGGLNLFVR